jgi:hypothetical protein
LFNGFLVSITDSETAGNYCNYFIDCCGDFVCALDERSVALPPYGFNYSVFADFISILVGVVGFATSSVVGVAGHANCFDLLRFQTGTLVYCNSRCVIFFVRHAQKDEKKMKSKRKQSFLSNPQKMKRLRFFLLMV